MTSEIQATPQTAPAPEASPKRNGLQRLAGVLFAPVDTFREIAQKPDLLTPIVAILIVSFVTTFVVVPRMDFETAMREQMTDTNRNMSKEDVERMVRFSTAAAKMIAYVSPLLNLIFFVVIAAVLLLAFRLLGGEGTFKQAFSVSLYAWMPLLILGIVTTIVLLGRGTIAADEMATVVMSHLGFLVDRKDNPVLFALLSSIELFTIWTIVLFIIGFSFVSRMSRGKSAAIVLTLWAVMIILKVGFAAFSAAKAAGA